MYRKGKGSGKVHDPILQLLSINLNKSDELWKGSRVQDELDLDIGLGAKYLQ